MVRARTLALVAASIVLLSCTWLIGLPDLPVVPDATPGDTGSDAVSCSGPNLPPVPSTSSPNDAITLTAAVSSWRVGQSDAGPYYGFNLDKTCTCPGPDSCLGADAACDDPGGIDDSARQVFAAINTSIPQDGGFATETSFNTAVAKGSAGLLIEVSKYNGQPDDAAVTVTVYASQGVASFPTPPKLDGTDVWTIDPTSASGVFTTNSAYVANNELVATGLALQIIVGSTVDGPITIELGEALLTASIEMSGGKLTKLSNGLIGGRLDPAKFLPGLQNVPDNTFGGYLCGSADVTYQLIKTRLCNGIDIALSSAGDFIGGVCKAVSFGIGFEAVPANKGTTKAGPDAGQPCGPTWSDHC